MPVFLSAKIFQLLQSTPIYFFSFPVKKPAPFIEIFHEIPQMHAKHSFAFIGRRFMAVRNLYVWKINSPVMPVYSPGEVDIVGIHEKPFVKKANFFQGFGS